MRDTGITLLSHRCAHDRYAQRFYTAMQHFRKQRPEGENSCIYSSLIGSARQDNNVAVQTFPHCGLRSALSAYRNLQYVDPKAEVDRSLPADSDDAGRRWAKTAFTPLSSILQPWCWPVACVAIEKPPRHKRQPRGDCVALEEQKWDTAFALRRKGCSHFLWHV